MDDRVRYAGFVYTVTGTNDVRRVASLWRLPAGSRAGLVVVASYDVLERVSRARRARGHVDVDVELVCACGARHTEPAHADERMSDVVARAECLFCGRREMRRAAVGA